METDNSKEIGYLILELTLNGNNNFLDLESFLKHIFIGVEVGEYGFKGYHYEYLFPNKYGAYTTKKLGSGVYQIKFNSNKRDNKLKLPKTKIKLILGNAKLGTLKEITIKPFYNTYKICVVTELEDIVPNELDKNNILGIDLGIHNFLTTSNNIGLKPFIINGKIMKSYNHFYNKQIAFYHSKLPKNQFSSKKLLTLHKNRHCYLPHSNFIKKLEYKAKKYNIEVIQTEESYTSQASFLDEDFIPIYSNNNKKE